MSRLRPNTHTLFTSDDAYHFQYCENTTSYCILYIKTDNLIAGSLNNKEAIEKPIHTHRNKQTQEIPLIKVSISLPNSHNYTVGFIHIFRSYLCKYTFNTTLCEYP